MKPVAEYAITLFVLTVAAATVLLVATQEWQAIGPRAIGVSGRTLDSAPTALAVVALAGVVAVIATKGRVRQLVGVLVAAAGAAAIWRSAAALAPVSASRAEQIMRAKQSVNVIGGTAPEVTTHPVWGVLSVIAASLVLVAGSMVAVRGARWRGMSSRYRAPGKGDDTPPRPRDVDPGKDRARHDASLWGALERGEDPTA